MKGQNIGCFISLSYIDIKTLTPEHFERDNSGRIWIKKRRVKTEILSRIPLFPIAKMILDNYKGGDKLLPIQDPADVNKYLKDIAILCGINKRITFHTRRHKENFCWLLIKRLCAIRFSIGNDLETSLVLICLISSLYKERLIFCKKIKCFILMLLFLFFF